jgi:cyclase
VVSTYRHFTIEPLADGAWAVIHPMNPPAADAWAISNAGIIDLGDRTIIFDTLMTTAASAELRGAAEALTGRAPDVVIYSHAHNDHTWGGDRFRDALVVSSTRARAAMLAEGQLEVADFREVVADRVVFWAGASAHDDPVVRRDAPLFRPYWDGVAATLPTLELRYPDVGFDARMQIHGRHRRVELVTVERAHAAGDVFMSVPDARLAFCGDLLFVGCHPYLADGDVTGLRTALAMLETSGADRFVPGHGPVGDVRQLKVLADYLGDVDRVARSGDSAVAIPDAYRDWGFARFFPANVEFSAGGGRQAGQPPTGSPG